MNDEQRWTRQAIEKVAKAIEGVDSTLMAIAVALWLMYLRSCAK